MAHITLNQDNYDELKNLYDQAVKDKVEVFKFQGNDVYVTYAKYLLEYMKGELDKTK